MDIPAAPRPGRRSAVGLAGLVVAFLLLAPPPLLLAPLALLLLFSRPVSLREWLWMLFGGGAAILFLSGQMAGSLPGRLLGAGGLLAAGLFLAVSVFRPAASLAGRVVGAGAGAVGGVAVWTVWSGLDWSRIDDAVGQDLRATLTDLFRDAPPEQLEAALAAVPTVVTFFPALSLLQVGLGLALAWAWYCRVALAPVGPAPGPLADFRFSDHLIWGAILTLGLALAPLPPVATRLALNGVLLWAAWYALRGLGAVTAVVGGWPFPGRLLLVMLTILAFPIAASALLAIGIADTWLHFRNRQVPRTDDDADGSDSP